MKGLSVGQCAGQKQEQLHRALVRRDETKALNLCLQQCSIGVLSKIDFMALSVVAHHTAAQSLLEDQRLCHKICTNVGINQQENKGTTLRNMYFLPAF